MKKALILALCGSMLGGCWVHQYRHSTPAVTPVSPSDAMTMTTEGYSDPAIVQKIRDNGVERRPSADDIVAMNQSGVSNAVVTAMLEAPVTQYRPGHENRTTVVEPDAGLIIGAAAVIGAILDYKHHRRHHTHYHGCGCR